MGLAPSHISQYECGRREPSLENLRKICRVLSVSADVLLGLQDLRRLEPIYRCKAIKPGDRGIVDGCGWQGTSPGIDALHKCFYCPACYSRILRVVA